MLVQSSVVSSLSESERLEQVIFQEDFEYRPTGYSIFVSLHSIFLAVTMYATPIPPDFTLEISASQESALQTPPPMAEMPIASLPTVPHHIGTPKGTPSSAEVRARRPAVSPSPGEVRVGLPQGGIATASLSLNVQEEYGTMNHFQKGLYPQSRELIVAQTAHQDTLQKTLLVDVSRAVLTLLYGRLFFGPKEQNGSPSR